MTLGLASASTLVLPARAKLNLDLEVVGRRGDGFHELRTTFQAIELHDLLEVTGASDGKTSLQISGLDIQDSEENSVLKAHRAMQDAVGRELPTRFRLHKRIPSGSGMGGASSDAAAALRGLKSANRLDTDLLPIARGLGADVAFFVAGGRALAEGRGDLLTRQPTQAAWFAVAWPRFPLSTAAVYRAWDDVGGEPPNGLRRAAEHIEPRLKELALDLSENVPGGVWQLTGSGSAFFRRCVSHEQGAQIVAALQSGARTGHCWVALTCAVDSWA